MSTGHRIFLAHAREDKPQVRKLYADLKARGFDPWLDEKDLRAGQIWETEIKKAIREAGLFLAFLSSRSVEKVGYVQSEFRQALSAYGERPPGSIYLIPVRLDECDVPDLQMPHLGLRFRDIQWVDLWQEGGFDRLVSDLEHALGISSSAPGVAPAADEGRDKTEQAVALAGITQRATGSQSFRDIEEPWCPELVIIPAGSFMMGSTGAERRWAIRQGAEREWVDWEKPQHRVTIREPFAVGKYEVTRGQFAAFVEATAHDMSGGCRVYTGGEWEENLSADWRSPGFEQTDRHPVVCVSWEDAKAYAEWLSKETGQRYRLLSEVEWEYACRAGTTTRYWWGDDPPTPEQANFGMKLRRTTEVGSYPPNPWGLCDTHGNVWEWCEDCWNDSYEGAPNDASAWTSGDCSRRVLRGGSWFIEPAILRSAFRRGYLTDNRYDVRGFRVARTLLRSESWTLDPSSQTPGTDGTTITGVQPG